MELSDKQLNNPDTTQEKEVANTIAFLKEDETSTQQALKSGLISKKGAELIKKALSIPNFSLDLMMHTANLTLFLVCATLIIKDSIKPAEAQVVNFRTATELVVKTESGPNKYHQQILEKTAKEIFSKYNESDRNQLLGAAKACMEEIFRHNKIDPNYQFHKLIEKIKDNPKDLKSDLAKLSMMLSANKGLISDKHNESEEGKYDEMYDAEKYDQVSGLINELKKVFYEEKNIDKAEALLSKLKELSPSGEALKEIKIIERQINSAQNKITDSLKKYEELLKKGDFKNFLSPLLEIKKINPHHENINDWLNEAKRTKEAVDSLAKKYKRNLEDFDYEKALESINEILNNTPNNESAKKAKIDAEKKITTRNLKKIIKDNLENEDGNIDDAKKALTKLKEASQDNEESDYINKTEREIESTSLRKAEKASKKTTKTLKQVTATKESDYPQVNKKKLPEEKDSTKEVRLPTSKPKKDPIKKKEVKEEPIVKKEYPEFRKIKNENLRELLKKSIISAAHNNDLSKVKITKVNKKDKRDTRIIVKFGENVVNGKPQEIIDKLSLILLPSKIRSEENYNNLKEAFKNSEFNIYDLSFDKVYKKDDEWRIVASAGNRTDKNFKNYHGEGGDKGEAFKAFLTTIDPSMKPKATKTIASDAKEANILPKVTDNESDNTIDEKIKETIDQIPSLIESVKIYKNDKQFMVTFKLNGKEIDPIGGSAEKTLEDFVKKFLTTIEGKNN